MAKRALLLFTSLLLTIISVSQTIDTMIINLDEVTVEENRIQLKAGDKPAGIIIINKQSLKNYPSADISDALHFVPGVDIRSRGVNGIQNDISIRGSSVDQVLVMINGIRISDPQTGHHNMNIPLPLEAINRVEVYKGPAARVFGQNSFAGAVNIITRIPDDNSLGLGINAGDFGLAGANFDLSFGNLNFRNMLALNYNRSDGYRYNTDYQLSNLFYQSDLYTRSGRLSFMGGISSRSFGANGFYANPDYTDQYEAINTSLASLSFEPYTGSENLTVSNSLNIRYNTDDYIFIRNNPGYYHNLHNTFVAGYNLNIVNSNKLGITGFGIDLGYESISSNRLGNRSRNSATIFLDHRIEFFNKRLSLTPGLQLALFSGFKNSMLPGVDIGYNLSKFLITYVNTGYTYRVPTYTDLYYEDPVNGSNEYLEPEYSFSFEYGIKTRNIPGLSFQAGYFYREGNNLIDRVKDSFGDKWIPENINNIIFQGIDISSSLDFNQVMPGSKTLVNKLDISYCHIDTQLGEELPEYSRFAFENLKNQFTTSVYLSYLPRLTHTISYRFYSRVNMNDYSLWDTRLGWQGKKTNFFFDISNITSTEYREANLVIMPGRWFRLGISYRLGIS